MLKLIRLYLLLYLTFGFANQTLAQIPATPSNLQKSRVGNSNQLIWTDNATNETFYVVERSLGTGFRALAILSANVNIYQDIIEAESFTQYRIQAISLQGQSDYTYEEALIPVSVVCGQSYCYPESCTGTYSSVNYMKSFQTPCADCQLKVTFSRFDTQQGNDRLSISDGNSVNAPFKGSFSGSTLPPSIVSSGRTLTFSLDIFFSTFGYSGWQFNTQCLQRPGMPGNLTVSDLTSSQVTLRWVDNSSDEEFFEVQQSTSPLFDQSITNTFTTPSNTTLLVLTNLDFTTTYYFRVRALKPETQSFFSPTVSATTTSTPFDPISFAMNIPTRHLGGAVKMGDFNNDKLYDLAVYDLIDEYWKLRIYQNIGNGNFQLKKEYGTAQITISQAEWSDIDNDSDLDLVVAEGSAIILLINNGMDFDARIAVPQEGTSYYYTKFQIEDYDHDGDKDIFVYANHHLNAAWYRNEKSYEFTPDPVTIVARQFNEVKLADINNDGLPDLLTMPISGGFAVYERQSSGEYREIAFNGMPIGFSLPLVFDVDNDGDQDLVGKGLREIVVSRNMNGVFVHDDFVSSSAAGFVQLAAGVAGDIDNDGDMDIVYGSSTAGAVVFINKGSGLFSPITNFYFNDPYYSNKVTALVDYDNDFDLDIITSYPLNGGGRLWKNNTSRIDHAPVAPLLLPALVSNDRVQLSWNPSSDDQTSSTGLRYDFFVSSTAEGADVHSSLSYHDANMMKTLGPGLQTATQVEIRGLQNGIYYYGVRSFDPANKGSSITKSTFEVTSSTFIDPVNYLLPVAYSPYEVDLTWRYPSASENGFIVLRSDSYDGVYETIAMLPAGTLSFRDNGRTPATNYYYKLKAILEEGLSPSTPVAQVKTRPIFSNIYVSDFIRNTQPLLDPVTRGEIHWIDFNNDGIRDFSWSANYDPALQLYTQDSAKPWHFTALPFLISPSQATLTAVRSMDWADFDNDGDIDLAVAGAIQLSAGVLHTFAVLVNNGNYSFQVVTLDNPGILFGESIRWGDFDSDGDMDVLASTLQEKKTIVYRNNGGNSFAPFWSYGNGGWVEWIDANNDGLLDVFISVRAPNDLGLNFYQYFLYNGREFQIQPGNYFSSGRPSISDPDSDGDEDILISGLNTGSPNGPSEVYTGLLVNDRDQNKFVVGNLGIPQSDFGYGTWIDYDNDDQTDVIQTSGDRIPYLYKNTDNMQFEQKANFLIGLDFPYYSVNDIDGDSDLDLIANNVYGPLIFENNSKIKKAKPLPPISLHEVVYQDSTVLSWMPVNGRLNVTYNVMIGTEPGKSDVLNSMSDVATGFRKINKGGNARQALLKIARDMGPGVYFWGVQSIDQNFQGSVFANSGSFSIGSPTLPQPVIVEASGISSRRVQLTLQNQSLVSANKIIFVSTDGSQYLPLDTVSSGTTNYVHNQLEPNHSYYYRLVFYNGNQYSLYSPPITTSTLNRPTITGPTSMEILEDHDLNLAPHNLTVINSPGFPANYQLLVSPTINYDIINHSIIRPHQNFYGSLSIPVRVTNVADTSNVFLLSLVVTPVNDPPQHFNLILPLDNSSLTSEQPIQFKWTRSLDVEAHPITYTIRLISDSFVKIIEGIVGNEYEINLSDRPDLLGKLVRWSVTASDSDLETVSSDSFTFVYLIAGMEDPSNSHLIYPNPAGNFLLVKNQTAAIAQYSILDSRGVIVQSAIINENQTELLVDVSQLGQGLYLLKLSTVSAITSVRFIKN